MLEDREHSMSPYAEEERGVLLALPSISFQGVWYILFPKSSMDAADRALMKKRWAASNVSGKVGMVCNGAYGAQLTAQRMGCLRAPFPSVARPWLIKLRLSG